MIKTTIKSNRLYNAEYRRNLVDKITLIQDNKLYFKLFNELKNKKDFTYSRNKNGIFFDINKLSDDTITNIKNFINDNVEIVTETEKLEFIQYSTEDFSKINNKGNRFNNNELNLLKIYKKN